VKRWPILLAACAALVLGAVACQNGSSSTATATPAPTASSATAAPTLRPAPSPETPPDGAVFFGVTVGPAGAPTFTSAHEVTENGTSSVVIPANTPLQISCAIRVAQGQGNLTTLLKIAGGFWNGRLIRANDITAQIGTVHDCKVGSPLKLALSPG